VEGSFEAGISTFSRKQIAEFWFGFPATLSLFQRGDEGAMASLMYIS
jgi:hypothetical protein